MGIIFKKSDWILTLALDANGGLWGFTLIGGADSSKYVPGGGISYFVEHVYVTNISKVITMNVN